MRLPDLRSRQLFTVLKTINEFRWLQPILKRRPWKNAESTAEFLANIGCKMDLCNGIVISDGRTMATFGFKTNGADLRAAAADEVAFLA